MYKKEAWATESNETMLTGYVLVAIWLSLFITIDKTLKTDWNSASPFVNISLGLSRHGVTM